MSGKDDLQIQNIQLDMISPGDPTAFGQFIEWAKQTSARQKELQSEIDTIKEKLSLD